MGVAVLLVSLPAGYCELLLAETPDARPLLLQSIHQSLLAYRLLASYPFYTRNVEMEPQLTCQPFLSAALGRIRGLLLDGGTASAPTNESRSKLPFTSSSLSLGCSCCATMTKRSRGDVLKL